MAVMHLTWTQCYDNIHSFNINLLRLKGTEYILLLLLLLLLLLPETEFIQKRWGTRERGEFNKVKMAALTTGAIKAPLSGISPAR